MGFWGWFGVSFGVWFLGSVVWMAWEIRRAPDKEKYLSGEWER